MAPDWSRRDVLAVLGAPAALPLLSACRGRRAAPAGPAPTNPGRTLTDIRQQVRELVAGLSRRFEYAAALVAVRRQGEARVDAAWRSCARTRQATAVFTVGDRKQIRERAADDLTAAGLAAAAAELGATGSASGEFGAPRDFPASLRRDPRKVSNWLEPLDQLFARAGRRGGSRIVHREAYLEVDDTELVFVGDGRDMAQRTVRVRAGVAFIGASGPVTHIDRAERSGTMGLEALDLADDDLARAAASSLAPLIARPAPERDGPVVLDATATAALFYQCLGPALTGDRWHRGTSAAAQLVGHPIAAPLLTVVDDPSLASGYGSYHFDDEGVLAQPTTLIEDGVLRSPLTHRASAAALGRAPTANGRRIDHRGPAAPRPSNLLLRPGSGSQADLISGIDRGLLLEGALGATAATQPWTFAVRVARAREIVRGRLSGRLYGPCVLCGPLPAALAAIRAISATGAELATAGKVSPI
jgi:predicted Zn-dependent protease